MILLLATMLAISLSACSEKDGEDTAQPTVARITCEDPWIVEADPGELLVAVSTLERAYPELGPCCDAWSTTWTARLVGDDTLYYSEVEVVVDGETPRLRAVFPGEVESCELVIWR